MSETLAKIEKILENPPIELVILLGTLLLYLISKTIFPSPEYELIHLFFGGLIALEIILFVFLEIKSGVKKHGWKHEVVDTLIALLVAVALWVSATIVLNTSSPISAVVSCSMLPNLDRGDFVIVQGGEAAGYEINMTREEFSLFRDRISTVEYNNSNRTLDTTLYYFCAAMEEEEMCKEFKSRPSQFVEKRGPFEYHYATCWINVSDGSRRYGPCLKSVVFKEKEYIPNFSHDTIVYQPVEGDLFGQIGDIIHRVYFKVNVDGEIYYITKGDNNPVLDIQVYDFASMKYNSPVPEANSRGKVIGRVPYLGYFKLFISGFWTEDEQCHMQLTYEHY